MLDALSIFEDFFVPLDSSGQSLDVSEPVVAHPAEAIGYRKVLGALDGSDFIAPVFLIVKS